MRTWGGKAVLVGFVVCSCNGSVGSENSSMEMDPEADPDACRGNAVRCVVPEIPKVATHTTEISTRELERIAPIWSRDPEREEDAEFAALVADSEDRAWFFRSLGNSVEITTRDGEGGVLERGTVEAPRNPDAQPVAIYSEAERFGGPVLAVDWHRDGVEAPEWIKLGDGPGDIRQRFQKGHGPTGSGWTWDEDGHVYGVGDTGAVERRDGTLKLLWSQNAWTTSDYPNLNAIVTSTRGKLAVITSSFELGGAVLYMLDAAGNFIAEASRHLEFSPNGYVLTWPDASGYTITATDEYDGDLHIQRVTDTGALSSYLKVRSDADTDVKVTACSADRSGNVYCLAQISDQFMLQQSIVVCRIATDGAASCVELEGDTNLLYADVAALSDGALFITRNGRLARYEFPL